MDPAILAVTPAAPPPPGQFTNFVDPPSQQATIIAVCSVMMVFTLLFVCLRLYSSFRVTQSPGVEDYLCLVAMTFSFTYIGFILDLSYVARHMWDVPVVWFTENYWKIRFAQNLIQAFAFFTSRLPIFLLYLRLFGRNKTFRYAVYFGLAAAFAVYMSAIPLLSYFCTPTPGQSWGSLDVFAKCKELVVYAVIQGSCNIALDVFIFVLPLPTIFGLHLPLKKKLGVLTIFGTGFFAVIASGISLYYRYQLSYGPDINWNEGAFVATASVEINVAIICSSMPACSSFAKHVFEKSSLFGSVRSLFNQYILSSRTKDSSKKSKSSYDSSYPAGVEERSMGSRTLLPETGYVEVQEAKSFMRTNQISATDRYHQSTRSHPYQQGITRTVEMDIV